tara:strand:+ start:324 stop:506 length:183 start_codon:yes stop_codon:yes gene_type:complete
LGPADTDHDKVFDAHKTYLRGQTEDKTRTRIVRVLVKNPDYQDTGFLEILKTDITVVLFY